MGTAPKTFQVVIGLGLMVAAVASLCPTSARAADCGGVVACQCGDDVVADAVLTDDLNSCPAAGLRLISGNLDCADHQVSGPGTASDQPGLWLDGASGLSVVNCRVRNFTDGILVDGGTNNTLSSNVVFNNQHGIWVGSGATGTAIDSNEVRDNEDEGVHLGGGTSWSVVSNNSIHNNGGENLYLLNTTDNAVNDNVLDQSKAAAIFVKHSSDNTFTDNQILKRTVHIKGDSHDNVFTGTVLTSGGFILQALEESDNVWTYPHDTTVTGGDIDASTCFEFLGAHDNTVTGVQVDTCQNYDELEYGGLVPFGNSVSVIDASPEDNGQGNGGGNGGGAGRGKVKFNSKHPERDLLKVAYFFTVSDEILPASEDMSITLSDTDSVVFYVELPAGTLTARTSVYYRYKDKTYTVIDGLREVQLRRYGGDLWRLRVKGKAELSTADTADMTLSWTIGDDDFAATDTWRETSRGWRLKN